MTEICLNYEKDPNQITSLTCIHDYICFFPTNLEELTPETRRRAAHLQGQHLGDWGDLVPATMKPYILPANFCFGIKAQYSS